MAVVNYHYGPMFSGKTSALISIDKKIIYPDELIAVVIPEADTRSVDKLLSHDKLSIEKDKFILCSPDNLDVILKFRVVLVDEAQFIPFEELVDLVYARLLGDHRKITYLAGLDRDFKGELWESHRFLYQSSVNKIPHHAACAVCGKKATRTTLLSSDSSDRIQIGDKDKYEPRCFTHWLEHIKSNKRGTKDLQQVYLPD